MNIFQEVELKQTAIAVIRATTTLKNSMTKLESQLRAIGFDVEHIRNFDGPTTQIEYGEIKTWSDFKVSLEQFEKDFGKRKSE
ncbi:hypothetical protein CIG75_19155 [Tumebacillus algifaecis]|uniref:Uncharacterized protein n=1 Tax=Tumebacillus algifaecis TaxID=1214604 RepID=A0A223D5I3_9BACL|nr:hypothetical protein [Tumebacillus algifaecis]ASS76852.1 hypothetical protein CIG75_19155 [Tumebacillus algifaecis]